MSRRSSAGGHRSRSFTVKASRIGPYGLWRSLVETRDHSRSTDDSAANSVSPSPGGGRRSHMVVIPAKQARLRRACAEPGPSTHRSRLLVRACRTASANELLRCVLGSGSRDPGEARVTSAGMTAEDASTSSDSVAICDRPALQGRVRSRLNRNGESHQSGEPTCQNRCAAVLKPNIVIFGPAEPAELTHPIHRRLRPFTDHTSADVAQHLG
jgi:hypothetical protein